MTTPNATPELAGADLGRDSLYGALDILGSYGGYSAATIKAALEASSEAVSYADLAHDTPDAGSSAAFARIHDQDEARHLARRALAALTPREREVVEYRYGFRGYPLLFQNIAGVLGVTEGTVKALHFRAIRRMRDTLGVERLPSATS